MRQTRLFCDIHVHIHTDKGYTQNTTHMHTHAQHTHARTHARTHTHTHTHTCTRTHTYTHTHTHTLLASVIQFSILSPFPCLLSNEALTIPTRLFCFDSLSSCTVCFLILLIRRPILCRELRVCEGMGRRRNHLRQGGVFAVYPRSFPAIRSRQLHV